jgi:hypothetical protein
LHFSDRHNVVYAAASVTGVIPRLRESACMSTPPARTARFLAEITPKT